MPLLLAMDCIYTTHAICGFRNPHLGHICFYGLFQLLREAFMMFILLPKINPLYFNHIISYTRFTKLLDYFQIFEQMSCILRIEIEI